MLWLNGVFLNMLWLNGVLGVASWVCRYYYVGPLAFCGWWLVCVVRHTYVTRNPCHPAYHVSRHLLSAHPLARTHTRVHTIYNIF